MSSFRSFGCGRKVAVSRYRRFMGEKEAESYVASVPELKGCHTQAKSLDELMERIREAAELCLEARGEDLEGLEFVGVQRLTLA